MEDGWACFGALAGGAREPGAVAELLDEAAIGGLMEIGAPGIQQLQAAGGEIALISDLFLVDLIVRDGRVVGAWGFRRPGGELVAVGARAVVLAAGGAGRAFYLNVFPAGATGDGYAMALRAGAPLVNMEFIQIGPSIVYPFPFALSGVFWRLSPRITNGQGEEFLPAAMPEGVDLARAMELKAVSYPFTVRNESMWIDVAIYREIAEGRGTDNRCVVMDVSHNGAEKLEREAAIPLQHLLERGIDIRREAFEFAPAVQHFNGGVAIDQGGAAGIAGLFSAGENAGGQHGADRPGGNALADSQVFGRRAGLSAAEFARSAEAPDEEILRQAAQDGAKLPAMNPLAEPASQLREKLAWTMWRCATVVRTAESLQEAISAAQQVRERALEAPAPHPWLRIELANQALVCETVARAALLREESRGTHYRADCRAVNDPAWQRQIFVRLDGEEIVAEPGPPITPPEELGDLSRLLESAPGLPG